MSNGQPDKFHGQESLLARLWRGGTVENGFWARIGESGVVDANRWVYEWVEQEKTAAGYGGWTNKTNGRYGINVTRPARNTIEDNNDNVMYPMGNGVRPANLPEGFTIQPCPPGVIVWMRTVIFTVDGTATTEYWFSYENGVDGECP